MQKPALELRRLKSQIEQVPSTRPFIHTFFVPLQRDAEARTRAAQDGRPGAHSPGAAYRSGASHHAAQLREGGPANKLQICTLLDTELRSLG